MGSLHESPLPHAKTFTNRLLLSCWLFSQLLGELLLDRTNVKLMMRYVSDAKNLMQMMNLLKDGSRSIQFEAFHVFKARTRMIMVPFAFAAGTTLACCLEPWYGFAAFQAQVHRALEGQSFTQARAEGPVCDTVTPSVSSVH